MDRDFHNHARAKLAALPRPKKLCALCNNGKPCPDAACPTAAYLSMLREKLAELLLTHKADSLQRLDALLVRNAREHDFISDRGIKRKFTSTQSVTTFCLEKARFDM